MTRKLLSVLTVAMLAAPLALSAQIHTGISLAGGISIPTGDGSNALNSGYNVAAGLNVGVPLLPVGLRLEGAYNAWDAKNNTSTTNASANITSLTANGTFGLGLPYLIAGVGYYSAGGKATLNGVNYTVDRQSAAGLNGGVGLRFPLGLISTFAEVRYHKAMGNIDSAYIPITFGINF
jgi:hypothetical protein